MNLYVFGLNIWLPIKYQVIWNNNGIESIIKHIKLCTDNNSKIYQHKLVVHHLNPNRNQNYKYNQNHNHEQELQSAN